MGFRVGRARARRRNAPARVPYRRTRPYRRPAPLARRVDRHHRRAALSARVDDPLTDRSIARPDRVPMVDRDHRRTRGLRAASSASRRRIPSRVVAAAAARDVRAGRPRDATEHASRPGAAVLPGRGEHQVTVLLLCSDELQPDV